MKFDKILEQSLWAKTSGHKPTEHNPISSEDDSIKDYMKTLKSKGKKPYLTWKRKIRVKI